MPGLLLDTHALFWLVSGEHALGETGDGGIVHFERARLSAADRPDLARRVRWVSKEEGDGAGYDILSFARAGDERLIEVKTTCGAAATPFFISRNEAALAAERPDAFRLYRLHDFAQRPKLFEVAPPLEAVLRMETEVWRARVG